MKLIYKDKLPDRNMMLRCYDVSSRKIKEVKYRRFTSPKLEAGDYLVEEKTNYGYVIHCKYKESVIWSFRHAVSFLYTDFHLFNNKIFFGTGGNGGHFYALELSTGKLLLDINTGGTEKIAYVENCAYLQRKGNLIRVNLDDNSIDEELILKPKMGYYSPIWTDGTIIRTIVNDFIKEGVWNDFYLIEVSLK